MPKPKEEDGMLLKTMVVIKKTEDIQIVKVAKPKDDGGLEKPGKTGPSGSTGPVDLVGERGKQHLKSAHDEKMMVLFDHKVPLKLLGQKVRLVCIRKVAEH